MARKIRFPLEMDNGIEVRSMEELRENFSIIRILNYLKNGKLLVWLRDRYQNDVADAVQEMDAEDLECARKLCEIFDVPYEGIEEELKEEGCRQERISRLKQYTDKEEYESLIEQVAFNQEELYDLLDDEVTKIYLCGDRFSIPLSQPGITYTGINQPVAVIDSKEEVDWKKIQVTVRNVVFDSKYQAVLEEKRKKELAANSSMVCIDNKSLYKWNDEQERFDTFYEFQELDMYYRNIAKDEKYVYFMRQTGKYSRKYEIVSIDLINKRLVSLLDFPHKEAFHILCVRERKMFFRGQYPNTNILLQIDMKSKAKNLFMLDKYVQDILIDESGENAYIRVKYGLGSIDEIYRYELKNRKSYLISKVYNVHAMDIMNGYLMAWGKDTRQKASEEYYYFLYNTENGKTENHQDDSELFTQALWRDEKTEYRLGANTSFSGKENYPLYKTDLPNGKATTVCAISRKYDATYFLGKRIRIRKGYLYCMSFDDKVDGVGKGIVYEVNHIPKYRIRLSDYRVQQYNNGIGYVPVTM